MTQNPRPIRLSIRAREISARHLRFSEFRTPRRVQRRWRDVRRPTGRRSSRIGKAWGPNTRWVRRLPCRQERPTKALERALTASGRKSGPLAADVGLRGLYAVCSHDLAARARMARTNAGTARPGTVHHASCSAIGIAGDCPPARTTQGSMRWPSSIRRCRIAPMRRQIMS
jgi:hypothetical protein